MLFKQRSVYAKALEASSEFHLFIISVHLFALVEILQNITFLRKGKENLTYHLNSIMFGGSTMVIKGSFLLINKISLHNSNDYSN